MEIPMLLERHDFTCLVHYNSYRILNRINFEKKNISNGF